MNNSEAKALRSKLGLSQTDFWTRVGVEQSTSSRYEKGRNIPGPVKILLTLAYGSKATADAVYKGLRRA